MSTEGEERFHPTSGRFGGVVGIVIAVVVAAMGFIDGGVVTVPWVLPAAVLVGSLSWAMLLRPRVSVTRDELVLRQPFGTQVLPLAAMGSFAVGRVLECRVDGKRYVSAAIGRTVREVRRDRSKPVGEVNDKSYGAFVERRISELQENARQRVGDADPGGVRRSRAWPEILATVGAAVALGVTLFL
ncbi:hypothetical protein KUV85_01305 [Nocardioides panacisoli]|uniref:hypothetical protein n=1 Tax=Nocardioides panacisoli TaxID=627624 RepID=UPI001C62A303|nr:hypothetical protein [Nocardioides panacisoli]QYJ04345.1 hypothetical protein KUV85_01305 [Nocardioides panacisoli]